MNKIIIALAFAACLSGCDRTNMNSDSTDNSAMTNRNYMADTNAMINNAMTNSMMNSTNTMMSTNTPRM